MRRFVQFFILTALLAPAPVFAAGEDTPAQEVTTAIPKGSGLPVPRFVSLKSGKVHARTGPALRYPVRWVYQRPGLPVEVIQEFDVWRKIRDRDGAEGWVNQILIDGRRTAIIEGEELVAARRQDSEKSKIAARFEPGVIVQLRQCLPEQCEVSAGGYRGWVPRKFLWGLYRGELLD